MRLHRFIVPGIELSEDTHGISDDKLVRQLRRVLRVQPGEEIVIGDARGREAVAVVTEYRDDAVIVAMRQPYDLATESRVSVTLYAAVSKRDTFEWTVQKATECGATRIVPLITGRTVKQNLNFVRLRAIAKEAAEQSGRGVTPEIGDLTPFEDALVSDRSDAKYFASTAGGKALQPPGMDTESAAILIGPEGGFTEKEEALAAQNGWVPVSLGSRILRAETAAIVASYILAR